MHVKCRCLILVTSGKYSHKNDPPVIVPNFRKHAEAWCSILLHKKGCLSTSTTRVDAAATPAKKASQKHDGNVAGGEQGSFCPSS